MLDPAQGREEAGKVRGTAGPRQPRPFLADSLPKPGASSSSLCPARPHSRAALPAVQLQRKTDQRANPAEKKKPVEKYLFQADQPPEPFIFILTERQG